MKRIFIATALALPVAAHAFPVPSQDDYKEHTSAQAAKWAADSRMADRAIDMTVTADAGFKAPIAYPTGS